jgi:hypothetical protein
MAYVHGPDLMEAGKWMEAIDAIRNYPFNSRCRPLLSFNLFLILLLRGSGTIPMVDAESMSIPDIEPSKSCREKPYNKGKDQHGSSSIARSGTGRPTSSQRLGSPAQNADFLA